MKKVIATLVLMSGLTISVNMKAQTADPNAPVITFVQDTVDYGTITHNADGNREFKFTNSGKEPLIITNVHQSCGCTTPKAWPKEPIQPGQSGTILVHYTTDRVGQFIKTLTITSNASGAPKVIYIKGTVLPDGASTADIK